MEILDQMLAYLSANYRPVTKAEYERVIAASIATELPILFSGVLHVHSDEVERRYFLGSNVFASDPEQFLAIWKSLVAADSTTETGKNVTNSDLPSVIGGPEMNLALSATMVRSIFEAIRSGSSAERIASWANDNADEASGLLNDLASARKRERQISASIASLESSAGDPEQLAFLEAKLRDFRAVTPQSAKAQVALHGLNDAWLATQLFLREEPRQFREQLEAVANCSAISNLEHVGYAIVHVSQRAQGLALGSRILRSLIAMANADDATTVLNVESHLLKEDIGRLRATTAKTVMLGEKRLSVDWLKSPLGFITLAACRDSAETEHWAEALDSAHEEFENAVSEIETSIRKTRAEQEDLESEIAVLADAIADMNSEAQGLSVELASARERQTQVWARLDQILTEGLSAIHPEFSARIFDQLYEIFADALFENLPTRKLKKELLFGDLHWILATAQALVVAAYQLWSPGSASCPQCSEAPCSCSNKDPLDKVMDYCTRWHGLPPSQLSQTLNEYGDWIWGLFSTAPHLRTQKLIDLLGSSELQFDRVIFRLRLGSILEETWSIDEPDEALATHGLPPYWLALALLAEENSGKELPLAFATELVEAACLHPNPHEYARDFWHDAATKYQSWKHENALKGIDEIPGWVPGPLD